jgi:UDP-glucuronate 4-epimerase
MSRVLVTGAAGFIGFHLSQLLLAEGTEVLGFDAFSDYYDVQLKEDRTALLNVMPGFSMVRGKVEDNDLVARTVADFAPDVIVHLAAQAGVRYSLENPRAYVESNITGTFNILEAARVQKVQHLMMASTSSAYGANTQMPFRETDKADHQLTIYAASKKAGESMGHAYAHLHDLPITMFRFFTVYGPWGRPDMAPIKFVKRILEGDPIDIYNHGDMYRDFTYVVDLVRSIRALMDVPPVRPGPAATPDPIDSLSPVAPYRVVNIGNGTKVKLMTFIEVIEEALERKAIRNEMPMQTGDVYATWANTDLLAKLTGTRPATELREGVGDFVRWYRDYYKI